MLLVLLGLAALSGTSAQDASSVNPCLDPTDADYGCELDASGVLGLSFCDITDEDIDDISSCLDDVGRENIVELWLSFNDLTTLPEGIFQNLTALETLHLSSNALTTLPEGIFGDLTALEALWLSFNDLTTLPEGIFQNLTALETLRLDGNTLECLPTITAALVEVDDDATAIAAGLHVDTYGDATALAAGLYVDTYGDATALAAGLYVDTYGDECGCSTANVTNVCGQETCTPGEFGYTCGGVATVSPVPAPTLVPTAGGAATVFPVPARTPVPTVQADAPASTTPAPGSGPTATSPAPSPAPSLAATSPTPSPEGSTSDSTPIVAGVVSAVVGAALIALGVCVKRRRASKQKTTHPPAVPPSHDDDNLEQGRDQTQDVQPPVSAVLALGDEGDMSPPSEHNASPQRGTPAEANGSDHGVVVAPAVPASRARAGQTSAENPGTNAVEEQSPSPQRKASPDENAPVDADRVESRDISLPSVPASLDGQVPSSAERASNAAASEGGGARFAHEDAAGDSAEKLLTGVASIATASTASISTAESAELAEIYRRQRVADAASAAAGPQPEEACGGELGASSAADRKHSAGDIGLSGAVLAAAQELAHSCQIPGVSEAASAVCIMANLVTDSRENNRANESRLRQCRSIVTALKRAAKVTEKGGETIGEAARTLIEDVQEAIFDLVELIKTYQSKNKLSRLLMSTLFKRRQEELDAVVDRAIMRLQLGLQVQVGQDVSAVKDDVSAVKDNLESVKEGVDLYQRSITEAASESVAEARRIKRQRKLDQVEIPEEYLSITDELLGKGGFGEVYLADYNGHNAAAKVLHVAHDLGALDDNRKQRETS